MSLAGIFNFKNYVPRWDSSEEKTVDQTVSSRRAVRNARRLEMRAVNCVAIAQAMLPNSESADIEALATDLMQLDDEAIQRTLAKITKYSEEHPSPEITTPSTSNRYEIAKDSALPPSNQPDSPSVPSYTKPELTQPEYSMKGKK